ncbi:hypothetical protein BT63DRAFT_428409 [Microthyrium microscopicum]|uniref:Glc8 protein n=1 Tax=Microthyrium microscopicum TaxID=703497 RepID=A0A6A6U034_9PEZI|nr:hypothetical protein BT63DRAFT_428409 [Microthyrium microscopicum]
MTSTEQPLHSPPSAGSPPKRPKGILKNRSTSNTNAFPPTPDPTDAERQLVLENTLRNAGDAARRPSSTRGSTSRRASHASDGENSPRLKWDEANLYLAEQEREAAGERMKIDEPKTPFAKQYDPDVDDVEVDAEGLVVDEMDAKQLKKPRGGNRMEDIPAFELGEPEVDVEQHVSTPESEKRVMVEEGMGGTEEPTGPAGEDEVEKHRKFEEMRKKHYEMKDVRGLLGHPEFVDEDE